MPQNSVERLDEEELRELIPEFHRMTQRHKRAEQIQRLLFDISETALKATELKHLFSQIHDIIDSVLFADNLYVCFFDKDAKEYHFAYFIDEHETLTQTVFPAEDFHNSLTEHVIKTARPLIVKHENFSNYITKYGLEILNTQPIDFLGVPLFEHEQVIGCLVVQSYRENVRFSEEDLEILQFVSQHIVTAVERVRGRELIEQKIQRRTKELKRSNDELAQEIKRRKSVERLQQALFSISELAASPINKLQEFYEQLHDAIRQLIPSENCVIMLMQEEKLTPVFFNHPEPLLLQPNEMMLFLCEYFMANPQTNLITSAEAIDLATQGEIDVSLAHEMLHNTQAWLGTTLKVNAEVFGVIALPLYGDVDRYSSHDVELLRFVSRHIAITLDRRRQADALKAYASELAQAVDVRTAELEKTNQQLHAEIEKSKQAELKLMHDAFHDGLTGLTNRSFFIQRLEQAVANKKRHEDNQFAVIFIDLDRFKLVNDTLGHQAGDCLLKEVSSRLRECVRDHDTLARFGGDEFVILLENYRSADDIEIISQRILTSLNSPFVYEGKPMHSAASLGIAPLTTAYERADEVLRDADVAMYQAKFRGRAQAVLFDESMREELDEAVALESEFRTAMADSEFECFLHPIVDLQAQSTLMYQCTIHWHHPTLGKIKRDQFWQIAEQSNLTTEIDNLLLERCIQYLQQHKQSQQPIRLAVNLSMSYITQPHMTEALLERLNKADIALEQLAFTFAERQWQYHPNLLKSAMKKLKRAGIMVILDEFGSGKAAINDLFIYAFDMVQLDKKICQSIPRSQRDIKFLKAVKYVTDQLELPLVASGIHEQNQLDCITGLGMHLAQGKAVAQGQRIYD